MHRAAALLEQTNSKGAQCPSSPPGSPQAGEKGSTHKAPARSRSARLTVSPRGVKGGGGNATAHLADMEQVLLAGSGKQCTAASWAFLLSGRGGAGHSSEATTLAGAA